jgi:2-methylcitrate dehydratase PrpD
VKPYPGCAYIDTTVDAAREIARCLGPRARDARALIEVRASALTILMDRLSHEHEDRARLRSTNVNFNIPINVAIALLDGDLGAMAVSDVALAARREEVLAIADRVTLVHDWDMTLDFMGDLERTIGLSRVLGGIPVRAFARAARRMAGRLGVRAEGGSAGLLASARGLSVARMARLAALLRAALRRGGPRGLEGVDMAKVGLAFAARVTVRTAEGEAVTAERTIPSGAARAGDIEAVAVAKWRREAAALGERRVEEVLSLARSLESAGPRALLDAATAPAP